MTTTTGNFSTNANAYAAALFKKLGLTVADEKPIMAGWREANALWRQKRRQQIAAHARRVREDQSRVNRPRSRGGSPRPVWCVELRQGFKSMSDAARFVNLKASHIAQAISRGGVCGGYHWEFSLQDGGQ